MERSSVRRDVEDKIWISYNRACGFRKKKSADMFIYMLVPVWVNVIRECFSASRYSSEGLLLVMIGYRGDEFVLLSCDLLT